MNNFYQCLTVFLFVVRAVDFSSLHPSVGHNLPAAGGGGVGLEGGEGNAGAPELGGAQLVALNPELQLGKCSLLLVGCYYLVISHKEKI